METVVTGLSEHVMSEISTNTDHGLYSQACKLYMWAKVQQQRSKHVVSNAIKCIPL